MTDIQHLVYPAQAALRPFVRRVLHGYSEGPTKQYFRIPPSGSVYLTLSYAAPIYVRLGEEGFRQAPRLFIGGQVRRFIPECEIDGRVDMLGVEFTPNGFYRLFQIDCSQLTDCVIDLSKVLPELSCELGGPLLGINDVQTRVDRLQDYFYNRIAGAVETPSLDRALALIERHGGRIGGESLAREACVSLRQLQRQFLKCVGIGPKHYAKTVQLKHAFAALQSRDTWELQAIAQTAGYYDQAHFIRDFQRLIGSSPTAFLNHHDGFLETYLRHCSD